MLCLGEGQEGVRGWLGVCVVMGKPRHNHVFWWDALTCLDGEVPGLTEAGSSRPPYVLRNDPSFSS